MNARILLGSYGLLLLWHLGARLFQAPLVLPTPEAALRRLWELGATPQFWYALLRSGAEVGVVLLSVMILGLSLGFLLGISPAIMAFCRPLLGVFQAVPVISWLGIVVFTVGIGWKGPVLISTLSLLPVAVLTTASGVRALDTTLLEMARVYGVSRKRQIRVIYAGAMVPFVEALAEVALGNAWKVVFVTEYLCGDAGLGVLIAWARQGVDAPAIYALSMVAIVLGVLSERIFRAMIPKLKPWQGRVPQ